MQSSSSTLASSASLASEARPSCPPLRDTVLSTYLSASEIDILGALGEVIEVPNGTPLFSEGDPSHHLYVVLDGMLLPQGSLGEQPSFWVGPGDLCGETGFVLGTPRRRTLMALGPRPLFWRIHRDVLAHRDGMIGAAATRLLAAAGRALALRLEPQASASARDADADLCDMDHPEVTALAARLARATPRETAFAIWAELWKMPYRFGGWRWTASDTILRRHGMCTTKAVLQVALLRKNGIEAGYVQGQLLGPLVRACMLPQYAPRFQRDTFKHYYCAVRLDGQWIPLDSSYSVGSLSLIARTETHVAERVSWDAAEEGFANGAATLAGADPFDIRVVPEIDAVLRKTPTYDARNAEAMNVLLDRAQGFVPDASAYVTEMQAALSASAWDEAREVVLAGVREAAAALRGAS